MMLFFRRRDRPAPARRRRGAAGHDPARAGRPALLGRAAPQPDCADPAGRPVTARTAAAASASVRVSSGRWASRASGPPARTPSRGRRRRRGRGTGGGGAGVIRTPAHPAFAAPAAGPATSAAGQGASRPVGEGVATGPLGVIAAPVTPSIRPNERPSAASGSPHSARPPASDARGCRPRRCGDRDPDPSTSRTSAPHH